MAQDFIFELNLLLLFLTRGQITIPDTWTDKI